MESMTWETLNDATPGEFRPGTPHYDADSDSLTIFIADDESYREHIDRLLTVYRSNRSKEVVGCHIKNVTRIAATVHAFHVGIESRQVTIGLLLLGIPLTGESTPVIEMRRYREIVQPIAEQAGASEVTLPDLCEQL